MDIETCIYKWIEKCDPTQCVCVCVFMCVCVCVFVCYMDRDM